MMAGVALTVGGITVMTATDAEASPNKSLPWLSLSTCRENERNLRWTSGYTIVRSCYMAQTPHSYRDSSGKLIHKPAVYRYEWIRTPGLPNSGR